MKYQTCRSNNTVFQLLKFCSNLILLSYKIVYPRWDSRPRSPSYTPCDIWISLQWRHNERDGVSNHQPHDCLLNRLSRRRSKKISKLRVTGLCAGNSPVTGEFPTQMASDTENVSIGWRHHVQIVWFRVHMFICSGLGNVRNRDN